MKLNLWELFIDAADEGDKTAKEVVALWNEADALRNVRRAGDELYSYFRSGGKVGSRQFWELMQKFADEHGAYMMQFGEQEDLWT